MRRNWQLWHRAGSSLQPAIAESQREMETVKATATVAVEVVAPASVVVVEVVGRLLSTSPFPLQLEGRWKREIRGTIAKTAWRETVMVMVMATAQQ